MIDTKMSEIGSVMESFFSEKRRRKVISFEIRAEQIFYYLLGLECLTNETARQRPSGVVKN